MTARIAITCLFLVVAACGSPSSAPATTAVPPAAGETTNTTPPTPPPSTTSLLPEPETTTTVTHPPATVPMEVTAIPLPEPGAFIERALITDRGILASGYVMKEETGELARPMLWFSSDQGTWSGISLIELYPGREPWEAPVVTDIEQFAGRFYAFLMGDAEAEADEPPVLVSDDGITWRVDVMAGLPALRTVAYTPDSPPYPGASAVADAVVDGGRLFATGWAQVDGATVAAVWQTADGGSWTMTELPPIAFPNEWGAAISSGPHGLLVTIGGPVYSGAGVLHSADGTTWSPVADVEGQAAASLGQNEGYAYILRFDIFGDFTADVLWTDDGTTWTASPPVPTDDASALTLAAAGNWDPVVFSTLAPARAWVLDRGSWEAWPLPAVDRLVDVTPTHGIGVTDGELIVWER